MVLQGWRLDSASHEPLIHVLSSWEPYGPRGLMRRSMKPLGITLATAIFLLGLGADLCVGTAYGKKAKGAQDDASGQSEVSDFEDRVLRHVNAARTRQDLPPLEVSPALVFLSRRHSENMCETQIFEHESKKLPPGWENFPGRLKKVALMSGAENIAYRTITRDTDRWAEDVVKGWMKSPVHRRNILNPQFRFTGVGVRLCENRLGYATQVFSRHPGRFMGNAVSPSGIPGSASFVKCGFWTRPKPLVSRINAAAFTLAIWANGRE